MAVERLAVCHPEFQFWVQHDRRVAKRLLDLVKAILRDPFMALVSPSPCVISAQTCGRAVSPKSTAVCTSCDLIALNLSMGVITTDG